MHGRSRSMTPSLATNTSSGPFTMTSVDWLNAAFTDGRLPDGYRAEHESGYMGPTAARGRLPQVFEGIALCWVSSSRKSMPWVARVSECSLSLVRPPTTPWPYI